MSRTKKWIVNWLKGQGVGTIIVAGAAVRVDAITHGHPKKEAVAEAAETYWRGVHPEAYGELAVDRVLGEHKLLFLPPYASVFNPIEKMWRCLKERLRSTFVALRTETEIKASIGPFMYGNADFEPHNCKTYFENMLAYARAFIHNDELLSGDLGVGEPLKLVRDPEVADVLEGDDDDVGLDIGAGEDDLSSDDDEGAA